MDESWQQMYESSFEKDTIRVYKNLFHLKVKRNIMKEIREQIIANGLETLALNTQNLSVAWHSASLFEMYKVILHDENNIIEIAAKVMLSKNMADQEMKGLLALAKLGCNVPKVYGTYSENDLAVLYMEFVPTGYIMETGAGIVANLEKMYMLPAEKWGWEDDNFIGSLPQKNGFYSSFAEFYWESRFQPLLETAIRKGLLQKKHFTDIEHILQKFSATWRMDTFKPRLIHGDLWSGNILSSENGRVYFIDPSVAFSHPEQDLAMLQLFGSAVSLEQMEKLSVKIGMPEGLEERIPFWQIYPLLVHINLFGSSYVGSLERALQSIKN